MDFCVYIAYNENHDKFYIGQTYSINKRESEHNSGLSRFTSKYDGVWRIVYVEKFLTRSEAMKREKFLKRQRNKDFYRKLIRDSQKDN